jgi:hypothetical protein
MNDVVAPPHGLFNVCKERLHARCALGFEPVEVPSADLEQVADLLTSVLSLWNPGERPSQVKDLLLDDGTEHGDTTDHRWKHVGEDSKHVVWDAIGVGHRGYLRY